jgi:hypothetical protein
MHGDDQVLIKPCRVLKEQCDAVTAYWPQRTHSCSTHRATGTRICSAAHTTGCSRVVGAEFQDASAAERTCSESDVACMSCCICSTICLIRGIRGLRHWRAGSTAQKDAAVITSQGISAARRAQPQSAEGASLPGKRGVVARELHVNSSHLALFPLRVLINLPPIHVTNSLGSMKCKALLPGRIPGMSPPYDAT